MELGINFPWESCGHDFGPRPPAWAGAAPRDWDAVEAELRSLRALGLTVVRWWVFAGGVNLPVGVDPSAIADRRPLDAWPRAEAWVPRAPLPPLPRAFLEDFERLLGACARAGVALWPSLVSFEIFSPHEEQAKGVSSRGRAEFLLGSRAGFFDACLEPLLDVCESHRSAVAAFEIANEPGWALNRGGLDHPLGPHPPWVSRRALSEFLMEGVRRVARRHIRASIGAVRVRPRWLRWRDRWALARLADRGLYVHQLHHYPKSEQDTLAAARQSPIRPCWVGELPTARHGRWGDPGLGEDDPERYLEARLRLVESLDYEGALLWARRAADPQVAWGEGTRRQIAAYAGG